MGINHIKYKKICRKNSRLLKDCVLVLLFVAMITNIIKAEKVYAEGNDIQFTKEEQDYMKKNPVIYVAGNVDYYPLEYRFFKNGKYLGIVPDYLKLIEKQTGIQFKYIKYNKEEDLLNIGLNKQVEVVTAVVETKTQLKQYNLKSVAFVMSIPSDKKMYRMYLAVTDIADQRLVSIMEKCMTSITQEQKDSIYYKNAQKMNLNYGKLKGNAVFIIVILMFLFTVGLGVRYIRLKKNNNYYKYLDFITGGKNYTYLKYRYRKILAHSKNNYWLVCVNLNLTDITRLYGYNDAKEILKSATQILKKILSKEECFVRLYGDIFLVLLQGYSEKDIQCRIDKQFVKLSKSTESCTNIHKLHMHIGVYPLKPSDEELNQPLRYAMMAQEYAKSKNMISSIFNSELEKITKAEVDIEQEIITAFKNREFAIYFQPFYELEKNSMTGCEALIRWEHPEKGLLRPNSFIHIFQKRNMLDELDFYVFETVCEILKRRIKQEKQLFIVSCNFSRNNFYNPDFADNLIRTAESHGIPAKWLAIEITEGISTQTDCNVANNIHKISKAGFQIVIDNFGSEYGSFPDLIRYSVNIVKIDSKLVNHLDSQEMTDIVGGLIMMMHQLGIKVICSGVEKKEQEDKLRELKCDIVQGYLFYRPMEVLEFENLFGQKINEGIGE